MSDGAKQTQATGQDGSAPFAPSTCSALVVELERLRKRNSELQRRCQQAEAAVERFKREWDKHGGPRGGSFGRALLACYCADLERKLEAPNDQAHRRKCVEPDDGSGDVECDVNIGQQNEQADDHE